MAVFIISDTHFNHVRIISHCSRPFGNAEQMNYTMIYNWNNLVGVNDKVIHLGDFGTWRPKEVEPILKQLNGEILLIRGNHDHKETLKLFTWVPRLSMKIGKYYCSLNHRAFYHLGENLDPKYCETISKHEQLEYDFNLCGHTHNKWLWNGRNLNMSVEQWNYTPVPLEVVARTLEIKGL